MRYLHAEKSQAIGGRYRSLYSLAKYVVFVFFAGLTIPVLGLQSNRNKFDPDFNRVAALIF